MIGWKSILITALTSLSLSACASKPAMPDDVASLQERVKLLEEALKECDSLLLDCAALLRDCEATYHKE